MIEQVILETKCGCRRMVPHDMKRGRRIVMDMIEPVRMSNLEAQQLIAPIPYERRQFVYDGTYDMIDRHPFKIFREM